MNQPTLSLHMWLSLDNETRHKARILFSIPRSSNTVVNDGKIESDGTTNEDLQHLTVKKMQDFTLSESNDFHQLFVKVVDKIMNPEPVGVVIIVPEAKKLDDLIEGQTPEGKKEYKKEMKKLKKNANAKKE